MQFEYHLTSFVSRYFSILKAFLRFRPDWDLQTHCLERCEKKRTVEPEDDELRSCQRLFNQDAKDQLVSSIKMVLVQGS